MESSPQRIFLSAPGVFQAKPIQRASRSIAFKRFMCLGFLSLILPLNFWRMCMSPNASAWEWFKALNTSLTLPCLLAIHHHVLRPAWTFGSGRFVISWAIERWRKMEWNLHFGGVVLIKGSKSHILILMWMPTRCCFGRAADLCSERCCL